MVKHGENKIKNKKKKRTKNKEQIKKKIITFIYLSFTSASTLHIFSRDGAGSKGFVYQFILIVLNQICESLIEENNISSLLLTFLSKFRSYSG